MKSLQNVENFSGSIISCTFLAHRILQKEEVKCNIIVNVLKKYKYLLKIMGSSTKKHKKDSKKRKHRSRSRSRSISLESRDRERERRKHHKQKEGYRSRSRSEEQEHRDRGDERRHRHRVKKHKHRRRDDVTLVKDSDESSKYKKVLPN